MAMGTPPEVSPPSSSSPWYEHLAWYLDQAFRVPGTRWRFGWDAILGLVPGLGDLVSGVFQTLLIVSVARRGTFPLAVLLRMVANVGLDNTIGAIPLLGDAFDFFFKANTRNLALVRQVEREHRETGKVARGRHVGYLLFLASTMIAVMVATLWIAFLVARWAWHYVQGFVG
jgi:hypothetical protein